jgi:hypothetical protein
MSIWDRVQKDLVAGWTAIEDDQRPRLCAEQANELEEEERKGGASKEKRHAEES